MFFPSQSYLNNITGSILVGRNLSGDRVRVYESISDPSHKRLFENIHYLLLAIEVMCIRATILKSKNTTYMHTGSLVLPNQFCRGKSAQITLNF